MREYKENFWEELEQLDERRRQAQHAHDQALQRLFASRGPNGVAPPEAFDEYRDRMSHFDAAVKALQDFERRYTPYPSWK